MTGPRALRLLRAASLAALVLLEAGCAAPGFQDLYVPMGPGSRFGYSEQALSDTRYRVVYDAPVQTAFTYAGPERQRAADAEIGRAYDFALLRAAEIALAKGYPAFRIADRANDVDVRNYYDYPGPFGPPYWGWRRPWGYPYGPYYDNSYATLAVRVTLTVDLLKAIEPGTFDARGIQAGIRAHYAPPPASSQY